MTAKTGRDQIAARFVWSWFVLASCGGSTFTTDETTDAAPDAGAMDSTSGDGADAGLAEDGAVAVDVAVPDGRDVSERPADAARDETRPADAGSEAHPRDAGLVYRSAVLADAPLAYWRMGISSGSIVPDESGHQNDLVLQGSGHTLRVEGAIAGDDDRAIGFDGVTSYAIALHPRAFDFPASAPFTIECWARRERTADGGSGNYFQQLVSASSGNPPNRNGYLLYLLPSDADPSVNHTAFEYDAPDQGQISSEGPLAPLSTYAYYVATFDGTKASLYIDGTLASSRAVSGSIAARETEFVVGRESSTGRYQFAGAIDEVAVYDKALSTLQVIAHRDAALHR